MQVLSVIHSLYALFGVSANLVLLVIILLTKSSGLKSYTVIISNVAVVDLIEIVIDAFEVPRMVAYMEDSILLFQGYCTAFGPELCYRCHLVMLHLIFHSLFLIAFSFWYRYVILVKTPPSWFTVQAAIVVLFIPNGVPMVQQNIYVRMHEKLHAQYFRFCLSSQRTIEKRVYKFSALYTTMDLNEITHRAVNLFDPFSAPTDYSAIFGPFIVYTYIVIMRRKALRELASLAHSMSAKTKEMHDSLIRALTYHAILPGTICIGVASFYFQMIGFRSSLIDGLIFVFACIPAMFNPLLTLYFVAPYRRKLLGTIRGSPVITVTHSLSRTQDSQMR